MADVYTVTFLIIGILLSFPALLLATNMLLPNLTGRAAERISHTPKRTFFLGLPLTAFFGLISAGALGGGAGPIRIFGYGLLFFTLLLGAIGAAGMTRVLAERLGAAANPNSSLTHLVRATVVFELAALFPILGWFIFIPIMSVLALGAAVFSLLKWRPRLQPDTADELPITVQMSSQVEQQSPIR